jgi:tRNA pseudouridine55 synthase
VSEAALLAVLPGFVGEQDQVAPLFSAKSVDGVRAYETARRLLREAQREGRAFDPGDVLQSSRINIYELELLSWHDAPVQDFVDDGLGRIRVASLEGRRLPTAMVRVACSKGTYIRALARDLGEALGSGAFLSSLRRTKNGGFGIEDAVSLEEVLAAFAAPVTR